MAYRRSGDLERAAVHLELQGPVQATFDDPLVAQLSSLATGSAVSQHRGFLAKASGHPARAVEEYRLAVTVDPENAEARRGFADALLESGELQEAIEQHRKLLEIDTNPAAAHFMLAGVLPFEMGIIKSLPLIMPMRGPIVTYSLFFCFHS